MEYPCRRSVTTNDLWPSAVPGFATQQRRGHRGHSRFTFIACSSQCTVVDSAASRQVCLECLCAHFNWHAPVNGQSHSRSNLSLFVAARRHDGCDRGHSGKSPIACLTRMASFAPVRKVAARCTKNIASRLYQEQQVARMRPQPLPGCIPTNPFLVRSSVFKSVCPCLSLQVPCRNSLHHSQAADGSFQVCVCKNPTCCTSHIAICFEPTDL